MRILVALVMIVITAGLAWLWFEHRPEPAREETVKTLVEPQAEIGAVIPGATPAESGATGTLAASAIAGDPESAAASPESRGRRSDPVVERRLAQNKEYVEARHRLVRITLPYRYPDLGRVLDMTPAAVDRLLDVLADQRALYRTPTGEDSTEPGAQALAEQERDYALKTAVAASIGQSRMERYEEYMASLPERYQVRELQTLLMNSPDALEFDDAQSAIEAMFEERQRIERELAATHGVPEDSNGHGLVFVIDGEKIADLDAASNSRIFAAAIRHLSPKQAQAFRESLDSSAEWQRLTEEMRGMRSDARSQAR